jgi:hypothetical protein
MSHTVLRKLLPPMLMGALGLFVTLAQAVPSSLFVRIEYGSASGNYPSDLTWMLDHNGAAGIITLTPIDGEGYEPDPSYEPPFDFSLAYVGDSLVVTALEDNDFADSGWYPMSLVAYSGDEEPIIYWNDNLPPYCENPPDFDFACTNRLASISPWDFPGLEGDTLLVKVTTVVPEPGAWALSLAGLGLIGWQLRRRSAART